MVGLGDSGRLLAGNSLMRRRSIADLHFADFDALLGQSFLVNTIDALPRSVRLAAVKPGAAARTGAANPRHECFSLAFCGPKGQAFPQGTYTFAHPQLGYFDLFVVPTMAVDHEERHIAIINRI